MRRLRPRICACRAAPSGPEQVRRRELRGCAHIVTRTDIARVSLHESLAMSELADEGVVLRLWMIMSVLVCVELPGARVLPGIVRLTCVHGCRLWYAREP